VRRYHLSLALLAVLAVGNGVARCDGSGDLASVRFAGTGRDRAILACAEDGTGQVTLRTTADDESAPISIELDEGSDDDWSSTSASSHGRGTASVVLNSHQWTVYRIVVSSPSGGKLRIMSAPHGCELKRAD
jgi:hypothetical protein